MKPSMKRKKDGRIIPYSEELVAAHPGEFLALKFDPAKRTFVEGAPLLPKAKSAPIDDDAVVFVVDDGREKPPAAPRVDPEPDTSDEEDEGEDSKPPASSKPAEPEQPPADKGAEPSEPEQGEPAPETPEQDSDATVEKTATRKKAKK